MENNSDVLLWVNEDGMGGAPSLSNLTGSSAWRKHSVSYQHNENWQGDAMYKFDKAMNDSRLSEAQGYTTLLQTGERELIVFYNRYLLRPTFLLVLSPFRSRDLFSGAGTITCTAFSTKVAAQGATCLSRTLRGQKRRAGADCM